MMKKVIVIGAGIAGLASAACLAQDGFAVTVIEKNDTPGGRARKFEAAGFTFDMGPSWYWMPDVFEKFFQRFGKKVSDYYDLKRLDPSYRVYYGPRDFLDVPAGVPALCDFFEALETGSSRSLRKFLKEGADKYELGMGSLVYKPGLSWLELADTRVIGGLLKLHVFQSLSGYVKKFFKNPRLISLLEFPVLFLGAPPAKTPALYSLMNYADMALGTWYPTGGVHTIVEGIVTLCREQGVTFIYNCSVTRIDVRSGTATGVWNGDKFYPADYIVASADYHHVEKDLLPPAFRRHTDRYWNSRMLAPSCLIFFLGLNKRVQNLLHHTLFFDTNQSRHIAEIYDCPRWPDAPLFYVCCPSQTDSSTAPEGCENIFILIPVAPGLQDTEDVREKYFSMVLRRMEKLTGQSLMEHVAYKRSYAHSDFAADYNAFKGNAYGLANTLRQTANLKPSIRNPRIANFFYTGHMTVPGPGVPPALISGQVAASAVQREAKKA